MGVTIEEFPDRFGTPTFWMATGGGLKPPFPTSFKNAEEIEFNYHWDWNAFMDACLKWDNLGVLPINQYEYEQLCDALDNKVSCYEIEAAYIKFCDCMQWYESKCKR